MPAGRPPDYSPEVLNKANQYITDYESIGDAIPNVAGLSVYLGVARSTVYKWAEEEDKAEFSDIVNILLGHQENKLINNGLNGKFNPTITKLLLHKHGHSDKQETDLKGSMAVSIQADDSKVL